MTMHTWLLFAGAVFLLCGTPGPNMLHIMTRSANVGLRRSVLAMAGCLTALVTVLAASAAGLTALLVAWPMVFDGLRLLGVAYLLWLGVKAWRGGDAPIDVGGDGPIAGSSPWQMLRGGFLVGISNPKLLLFAAAFLPQFVDGQRPPGPQYLVLVVTFAGMEAFWYAVYATGGRQLARHLTRPGMRRLFDRVTGTIFIGFGLALLQTRP